MMSVPFVPAYTWLQATNMPHLCCCYTTMKCFILIHESIQSCITTPVSYDDSSVPEHDIYVNSIKKKVNKWAREWFHHSLTHQCQLSEHFLFSSDLFHTHQTIWLNKQSQSLSLTLSVFLRLSWRSFTKKGMGWKPVYIRIMCLLWEPRGKVGKERVRGSMNRRIAFLSLLLWEDHHWPPLPFPLFPVQLGIYLLMQNLLYLLVQKGKPMQNCINTFECTGAPKHSPNGWMVYLFVIFMYSVLVTFHFSYRKHTFAPFLRHLWYAAVRFGLRRTTESISVKHNSHLWLCEKRWDFEKYCSQTITVYVCSCAYKAHSYHHPHHQLVAMRAQSGKIMAPCWIVWIIAMTGW